MFSFCELFTVCCGLDIGGFETEIEYLIIAPFYGKQLYTVVLIGVKI